MNLQTVSIIIIWLSNQSSVAPQFDHQDAAQVSRRDIEYQGSGFPAPDYIEEVGFV